MCQVHQNGRLQHPNCDGSCQSINFWPDWAFRRRRRSAKMSPIMLCCAGNPHRFHHYSGATKTTFNIVQCLCLILILQTVLMFQQCHGYHYYHPHYHRRAVNDSESLNRISFATNLTTTTTTTTSNKSATLSKHGQDDDDDDQEEYYSSSITTLSSSGPLRFRINDSWASNAHNRVIRSAYQIYHQQQQQPFLQSLPQNYELQSSSSSSSLSLLSSSSSTSTGQNVVERRPGHSPNFWPPVPYQPYFIQEPYGHVQFSNQYGQLLPCKIGFRKLLPIQRAMMMVDGGQLSSVYNSGGDGSASSSPSSSSTVSMEELIEKIYWEVRDERGSLMMDDIEQYVPVIDVPGLREHRHEDDGEGITSCSLAFMPFIPSDSIQPSLSSISGELHNSLYRCVADLKFGLGRIVSRSIHVNVVFEKSFGGSSLSSSSSPTTTTTSVSVRAYDTTVTDGNDAILKCTTNSELYQIVAWITDDEDIILPLEQQPGDPRQQQQTTILTPNMMNIGSDAYIPTDTRYYVLPSGELLIAAVRSSDLRRQFRCRAQHQITGDRVDSSNWARIKLRDQSNHISYRPRFNLDASLRHSVMIEDDFFNEFGSGDSEHQQSSPHQQSQHNHHSNLNLPSPPIDIYCSFDAQPPPNLTWYFISYFDPKHYRLGDITQLEPLSMDRPHPPMSYPTQHYTITSRHLRINQPTIRDVGTYLCVANNSHFQVRHETDLLSKRSLRLNMTLVKNDPGTGSQEDPGPFFPGETITLYCNLTHFLSSFDLPLTPPPPPSMRGGRRRPDSRNILNPNSRDDQSDNIDNNNNNNNDDDNPGNQDDYDRNNDDVGDAAEDDDDWLRTLNQMIQNRFMINYYWYHNHEPINNNNNNHNNNNHLDQVDFNGDNNHHHNSNNNNNKRNNGGSKGSSNNNGNNNNRGRTMIHQAHQQQQQQQQPPHYETLAPNVLRINQLDYDDVGQYQCFARLNGGPDFEQWLQSTTMITIRQSSPKFQQTFNEQILLNQQELSLKCSASGIPAPVIQWQRNRMNLTDLNGNLINLQTTTTSSSSNANNNHLYRYKTSTFQLKSSPTMFTNQNHHYSSPIMMVGGKSVPITSSSSSATLVGGGPGSGTIIKSSDHNHHHQQQQQQHQLQRLFQTVSYFNITSLRPQDVGQFRCLAMNRAGQITHQAKIGIIGPPYAHPIPDQTAVVGQSLSIQCIYSGYPIEEVFFIKSKRRLPFDERHLVGGGAQMGQLIIAQVDKSDDGDYVCIVVGENGQRAQQSFRIMTVMPPVLSPFIFSDALEEGTRATAVCSVISGDPPITLQWLKDGRPLLTAANTRSLDPHVQVLNIKEFISSLIITNITRRHQGVYTCLATTPNTSSNRTAVMRVKAPPKWLIKPSNKIAIIATPSNPLLQSEVGGASSTLHYQSMNNQNLVRFDCLASGNPTPVIRWKFLRLKRTNPNQNRINQQKSSGGGEPQTESIPILSSPQIHVLENGSLLIRSIDKSKFEGVYLCEVSNGVGKPLEARATLSIYQTPQIQVKVIPHGDGSSSSFKASPSSSSSLMMGINKLPSHQPSDHHQDQMVIQMAIRHHSQVSLSCTGTGTVPLFIGWYKNGHEINVYDAGSVTSTSSFRIFEPVNGGKTKLSSSSSQSSSSSSSSNDPNRQFGERTSNLMLKHVGRQDSAQYVCMARNSFGRTHRMVILHVLEPPDPPESLKAIEVGSRTVTLTWNIGYTGNMPLLSQNIEYKKEADKTWHNALMIKSNTNTVTIHGLQPLQPYEFRVSFVNELGTSEHSRSITLTTQMEAPTVMPDNVRALPLSTHAIRLTWSIRVPQQSSTTMDANGSSSSSSKQAPSNIITDIEIIDGFYIGYRAVPDTASNSAASSSSSAVAATNQVGGGVNHQSSSSSSSSSSSTMPSYTYKTISNTPMNMPNTNSNSLYSRVLSNQKYWKMAPPPPSSSTAANNRDSIKNQSILMKLNQSGQMIDTPLMMDGLLMMSSSSSSSSSASSSTSSSSSSVAPFHQYYEHVIDTLQRHTLYQFIVQAFNEKGAGPSSIEVMARTFAHDPPRPPNFRIENVSTHEALLSWDYSSTSLSGRTDSIYPMTSSSSALVGAMDQDHQDPLLVDGYVISYHLAQNYVIDDSNIGEDWQSITISSASTTSFTLRNLRCGSEYVTRIEAFNEMGSGKPSEMVRFSTLGSPPIPPDKYSNHFIVSNITFVMINLDLWSDGGCPITGYSIKYRIRRPLHYHRNPAMINGQGGNGQSGGWITLSTHLMPDKEKLIIRDLPPGTWHDLIIAAQNDAGKREAEYSFATLTETGATVEPLHAFESRMATNLGAGSISILGAFFDDPMLFIPAICTVIVLIVVISTSVFLYIMRVRQEQFQIAGDDTYCSHRSSTRLDEMSLNSYANSNGNCKKKSMGTAAATAGTVALNSTKLNGKIQLAYEKNGSVMTKETEPLYEQTNFAAAGANGNCPLSNMKAATFHKSPHHHHHQSPQQQQQIKSLDDSNLLMENIDLTTSNIANQSAAVTDQSNESYSFEPIFDHRDPIMGQYFKTLQQNRAAATAYHHHHHHQQQQSHVGAANNSSSSISSPSTTCHSSHLYQMPEQVKQQLQQQHLDAALKSANDHQHQTTMMVVMGEDCPIKTGAGQQQPQSQQQQQQQQHCQLIQKPALPNAYMTTFGIVRPKQMTNANQNC